MSCFSQANSAKGASSPLNKSSTWVETFSMRHCHAYVRVDTLKTGRRTAPCCILSGDKGKCAVDTIYDRCAARFPDHRSADAHSRVGGQSRSSRHPLPNSLPPPFRFLFVHPLGVRDPLATMHKTALLWALPFLVATTAMAAANYPAVPKDLTTPVQQRLAIHGLNSESPLHLLLP